MKLQKLKELNNPKIHLSKQDLLHIKGGIGSDDIEAGIGGDDLDVI